MGFGGKPKMPKVEPAPTPAKRPERIVEVTPEDVNLGSAVTQTVGSLRKSGKRSLARPSGSGATGGAGSGAGLSV